MCVELSPDGGVLSTGQCSATFTKADVDQLINFDVDEDLACAHSALWRT